MSVPVTVINIGYGRSLFSPANSERARLQDCAKETTQVHAIIFSSRGDSLVATSVDDHLTLHPTNARTKIGSLFAAYSIGAKLIQQTHGTIVIHCQDPFETGVIGYLLKLRFRQRPCYLVVQEHADVFSTSYWQRESFLNRVRYRVGLWVMRRADRIRVVARRITHTLEMRGIKTEIVQLPVAINPHKFIDVRKDRSASSLDKPFQFITVARFVPQKNVTLLITAFKVAYQKNQRLRLTIVGTGPEEGTLRAFVAESFPSGDSPVTIIGWSESVPELLQSADAYVLSSNYEGWGRVLIESMCAGLPVITTDVGCAGEVVLDGLHGIVVPVDDVEKLAAALVTISTNKTMYEQFCTVLQRLELKNVPGTNYESYGKDWVRTLTF